MTVSREKNEVAKGVGEVMAGNPRRLRQKGLHQCDEENKFGVGSQWSHLEKMGVLAPN